MPVHFSLSEFVVQLVAGICVSWSVLKALSHPGLFVLSALWFAVFVPLTKSELGVGVLSVVCGASRALGLAWTYNRYLAGGLSSCITSHQPGPDSVILAAEKCSTVAVGAALATSMFASVCLVPAGRFSLRAFVSLSSAATVLLIETALDRFAPEDQCQLFADLQNHVLTLHIPCIAFVCYRAWLVIVAIASAVALYGTTKGGAGGVHGAEVAKVDPGSESKEATPSAPKDKEG